MNIPTLPLQSSGCCLRRSVDVAGVVIQIHEGTNHIQQMVIARGLLELLTR